MIKTFKAKLKLASTASYSNKLLFSTHQVLSAGLKFSVTPASSQAQKNTPKSEIETIKVNLVNSFAQSEATAIICCNIQIY